MRGRGTTGDDGFASVAAVEDPSVLTAQVVATPQNAPHGGLPLPRAGANLPAAAVAVPAGMAAPVAPMVSPFDDSGFAIDDRFIGRGCTYVRQMGRGRLSECLEFISPVLESGFTAECTSNGLLCLLWLYTRVKPSVKLSDLLSAWAGKVMFCYRCTQLIVSVCFFSTDIKPQCISFLAYPRENAVLRLQ